MPAEIAGAVQGMSGFRRAIYRGPSAAARKAAPLSFRRLCARCELDLKPGLIRAELLEAIKGHVIGQGELVAIYERKAP